MPFFPPAFVELSRQITFATEIPDSWIMAFSEATWSVFGPGALVFERVLETVAPSFVQLVNDKFKANYVPTKMTLPFFHRPLDAFYAIAVYLMSLVAVYALAKVVGKRTYRGLGLAHNAFLFLLSVYMGFGIFFATVASEFPAIWNNPIADTVNSREGWCLVKLAWVFMMSKLPEYGDTYLMILKHNSYQISFLHLYHHSSVFFWAFVILTCGPGGDIYWASMCNSLVHVVMYGYYAGCLAFKEGHPVRRFLNHIKFHITKIQLLQFFLNIAQAVYGLILREEDVYYPRWLCYGQITYMLTMVVLFANYYIKNKGAKKNRKAAAGSKAVEGELKNLATESKKQK